MTITPVGSAIHDDFYAAAGSDIPSDALFEFTTAVGVVTVIPAFIRPHLALVTRLPSSLPLGAATLRLVSPSTPPSNAIAKLSR